MRRILLIAAPVCRTNTSPRSLRASAAPMQRATGGVGLGLSPCRSVAEAHGDALLNRKAAAGLALSVLLPMRA